MKRWKKVLALSAMGLILTSASYQCCRIWLDRRIS